MGGDGSGEEGVQEVCLLLGRGGWVEGGVGGVESVAGRGGWGGYRGWGGKDGKDGSMEEKGMEKDTYRGVRIRWYFCRACAASTCRPLGGVYLTVHDPALCDRVVIQKHGLPTTEKGLE